METLTLTLTDDELLAFAHSQERVWARPLATVAQESPQAVARAVGRGYRSLLVRGILSEEPADGSSAEILSLVLSLPGERPGIMATWVDHECRPDPESERMELFVSGSGEFVAATSIPSGIHTFRMIDGVEALTFFADLAFVNQQIQTIGEDDVPDFAILVRSASTGAVAGFLVGGEVRTIGLSSAGQIAPGAVMVAPTDVDEWRDALQRLLV